ncbi:MAG TPA: ROK family protein [Ktedonobacterales bacterium]|nr:ROK family protein [Ktedonobacterales bacterium]
MSTSDSPWPAPPLSVAVEIADAGTRLSALVGSAPDGRHIQERRATPLSADDAHHTLADFALRALRDAGLLDTPERQGIPAPVSLGVALRGRVNPATGVVHSAQGLPDWVELPLGERLKELFAVVTVENATNAAAVAECALGAAAGSENALYVAMGRQITSAYVVGGEVVQGAHDLAGQIGHWRVAASGPRCACGAEGHLDPVASAQSIVRAMIGRASDSDTSLDAVLRITNRRAEALTAAQVVHLADEGDPIAAAVIGAAVDGLASALANLTAVLDPAIIVLDGPFAGQWDSLIARIQERLREWTRGFVAPVTVVPSRLGTRAVLEGARLLAERRAQWARPAG